MEAEILDYKEQVAALDSALQADPANEELLTIKTELLELITLTETLLQQEQQAAASTAAVAPSTSLSSSVTPPTSSTSTSTSQPSSPPAHSQGRELSTQRTQKPGGVSASDASNQPIYQPPAPTRHWAAGDRCRALYAADGKFYEATILGVATGAEGPIYSVQYKGYETTAPSTLTAQDLKVIPDTKKYQKGHQSSASTTTEAGSVAGGVADGDKRKRGAEGGAAGEGAKKKKSTPSEQVQKQMAWQNFAKGGAKKAKGSGGLLKKSIFATPDNPEGKVGVVGSGKGMTQFQQRGKHVYGSAPSSQ
ncbi:hypothetical protein BG006_004986 [Podila minutissima]|uniref:Tudor domain-containing protein n=1 Tax=Podila minutissima TaxID=64525 RepID=A0A9P5VM10_9FUNG|nr:hypothetical protein BG006_004986 [Podila minutissima]